MFLVALFVGCSPADTDSGAEKPETVAEPTVVDDEGDLTEVPVHDSPSLARLETCEVDTVTATRIREAENRLDELLLRFTDRHPDVIATRQLLDDLVQGELDECVERLQAR